MTTYKIKYKNYISNLYLPDLPSGKVVLFLTGLPMSLDISSLLPRLIDAGCTVFYPYYAGTYDSKGFFSGEQSIRDVNKFIEMISQSEVSELYFNKKIKIENKEIILLGMSYGSSIALLGLNNKINKLILLSPVLLYNQKEIDLSFDKFSNDHEGYVIRLTSDISYNDFEMCFAKYVRSGHVQPDAKHWLYGSRIVKNELSNY